MIDTKEQREKVILIGISGGKDDDTTASSLRELADLADTAGAETVDTIIQPRERPDPGSYFGKGKIEEVRERVLETGATGVISDDELSPAQMKNLEEGLQVKVMDRTMVILDIFAKHAVTGEGKIQVELAQLRYSAAHLEGLRASLSRLGGGIGTRGPGESKIEMDRRAIHERIGILKKQLGEVERHREITRKNRERSHVFVAAIVGYTNAGKSTLLNRLTNADVLTEDKLFATLDPTTRKLILPGGQEMLLTDTVGFIRKLPHHLIEAFRSTLEEAKYADLILHVVDAGNPEADRQMLVVYDTLRELGITDTEASSRNENSPAPDGKNREAEIVTVFNKWDTVTHPVTIRDFHAKETVRVSAKTGSGIEELKGILSEVLRSRKVEFEKLFSYADAGIIQTIRRDGELLSEEYTPEGILVKARIPAELAARIGKNSAI